MDIYLTEMHSIRDALRTMYMSKRTWTPELEDKIKTVVEYCTDRHGRFIKNFNDNDPMAVEFDDMMKKVVKFG